MLCHNHLTNVRDYNTLSLKVGKEECIDASDGLKEAAIDGSVKEDIIGYLGSTDVEGERSMPLELISQRGQVVKGASQARRAVFESHFMNRASHPPVITAQHFLS